MKKSSSIVTRKPSPSVVIRKSLPSDAIKNEPSHTIDIERGTIVSRGKFRVISPGTYEGGYRDGDEAVCKRFKTRCELLEKEYFKKDFDIYNKVIGVTKGWNAICPEGAEINVNKSEITKDWDGIQYLTEPFIRSFTKFTSNNGWIDDQDEGWFSLAMEAFSHYSYHQSKGRLIVCNLQGRHRDDRHKKSRGYFKLSDPAICSRKCKYGPTDLGEKGIESFFANHVCNKFCHIGGKHWKSPKYTQKWFDSSSSTSMVAAKYTKQLSARDGAIFSREMEPIYEESDEDYYDDLSDERSVVSELSVVVGRVFKYLIDHDESDEESDEEYNEESDEEYDEGREEGSDAASCTDSDSNRESNIAFVKEPTRDSEDSTDENIADDSSSYDSR